MDLFPMFGMDVSPEIRLKLFPCYVISYTPTPESFNSHLQHNITHTQLQNQALSRETLKRDAPLETLL